MNPTDHTQRLIQHYADANLVHRLREALIAEGDNPDALSCDQIAPIDQLHLGGRAASRQLADKAGFIPGQQVLDLGCGTGGTSRLLLDEYGVQVIGVDITPAFIETAVWLTQACGLHPRAKFICADAQQLPLEAESVDAIWSQHTLMNLPNLEAGLAEAARVLKPGGQLLLHELLQGENPAPLDFPVPWADEAGTSHLRPQQAFEQALSAAGFTLKRSEDISQQALAWRQKHRAKEARGQTGILTPQLIFGPRFIQMGKNLLDNLASDKVRLVEAIWVKG